MPVFRIKLEVTVLLEEPSLQVASERIGRMSLSGIGGCMEEGDMVGMKKIVSEEEILLENVTEALEGVGSEAGFFWQEDD